MVTALARLAGPATLSAAATGTAMYTTPANATTMVREIILTNTNPSRDASVDLSIGTITTAANRIATAIDVPAASTIVAPITVVLEPGDVLRGRCAHRMTARFLLTNLIADTDASDATSYISANWTTTATTPYILTVINTHATAAAVPSSITDTHNGFTWTQEQTVLGTNGTTSMRVTQYRAQSTTAEAAVDTTVNFAGAQTGCIFIIDEVYGGDTSGTHGSAAITAQGTYEFVKASTGFTMISDDWLVARHFTFAHLAAEATTQDGRFTELGDTNAATPAFGASTAWSSVPGGDATPSWATSTANGLGAVLRLSDGLSYIQASAMGVEVT